MANVITGSEYTAIATYYGNIVTQLSDVSAYLYDAVYDIVLLNDYLPTLDLLDIFNAVYTANLNTYASLVPFSPAVKAINAHVVNRGPYTDVNAFLAATSATVPASWATLCASIGQTIDEEYISG